MSFNNVQEETGGPLIPVQFFQDVLGYAARSRCEQRRDGMLAENQERAAPQRGLTWETKTDKLNLHLKL